MSRRYLFIWFVALPWLLFAIVASLLITKTITSIDVSLLQAIHYFHSASLNLIMVTITQAADPYSILLLSGIMIGIAWLKNYRWQAIFLALAIGSAISSGLVLKQIAQRPRPNLWTHLVNETDFSFPSGHATITMAVALALILIAWPTRWRWPMVILGTIIVILVGLSRLYVGVHYPSDILGGWLLSIGWVNLVWLAINRYRHSDQKPSHIDTTP